MVASYEDPTIRNYVVDLERYPEEDRAAVEAERLAQLAGDRLENVEEVQRGRDFLEDLDDGEEVFALALEVGHPRREACRVGGGGGGGRSHGIVCVPGGGCVKLPPHSARDSFGAHATARPAFVRAAVRRRRRGPGAPARRRARRRLGAHR